MRLALNDRHRRIVEGDCLAVLRSMPPRSADVVVTSPPYNIGLKYHTYRDRLGPHDYLSWQAEVARELYRVLNDDGSYYLVIGGTPKRPHIPRDVGRAVEGVGWRLQNEIVWVKSIAVADPSGWRWFGSCKTIPGVRFVSHHHEYVLHFTKSNAVPLDRLGAGLPYGEKRNVLRHGKGIDRRCRGSVWFQPQDEATRRGLHPAAFPVGLAEQCLRLHGLGKDPVVLDPFLGSGTTLLACKRLGLRGVGIDLDGHYCRLASRRLAEMPDGGLPLPSEFTSDELTAVAHLCREFGGRRRLRLAVEALVTAGHAAA